MENMALKQGDRKLGQGRVGTSVYKFTNINQRISWASHKLPKIVLKSLKIN